MRRRYIYCKEKLVFDQGVKKKNKKKNNNNKKKNRHMLTNDQYLLISLKRISDRDFTIFRKKSLIFPRNCYYLGTSLSYMILFDIARFLREVN